MSDHSDIFGTLAPMLWAHGWAVLPATGKKPRMAGFVRWQHRPSLAVITRWAHAHADADIVAIPGLCRTGRGDALVIVDADDEAACGLIIELFGDTPGKVRTRRGRHYLYRVARDEDLGRVQSLRRIGLNADLKHGRGIVVLPPSRHQDDRDFRYAWDGCDATVLCNLPMFDVGALARLIERGGGAGRGGGQSGYIRVKNSPPAALDQFRHGSRGLRLNDYLCGHLGSATTFEALLERAGTFNASLVTQGMQALDEIEVVQRTQAVWQDVQTGRLEPWSGGAAVCQFGLAEVIDLMPRQHGGDAVALLVFLRCTHQARVHRSKTFAISAKAMAAAGTMGWTRERIVNARKVLEQHGYIKCVQPARNGSGGGIAAQYTLSPRRS